MDMAGVAPPIDAEANADQECNGRSTQQTETY